MAKADEPRISVRMTHEEHEAIQRAARVAGISDACLLRQCGLRWGAFFAAELKVGRVKNPPTRRRRAE